MYSKYSKWIHVLSILLALLSMGQFIFTSSLLFLISIILAKTAGYVATISGLIASLICLPTSFKIRSFYSGEVRTHHYDMHSYHRYMLYISLTVQTFCVMICCASLFEHEAPSRAMSLGLSQYITRPSDKKFVDIVQILFQCCGVFTYQDWAMKSWVYSQKQQIFCGGQFSKAPAKLQFSPTANCRLTQLSSVPYSCCRIDSMKPCKNFDLKCSGTDTVNVHGCITKLCNFIISILFSELSIYLVIIIVILALLKLQYLEMFEICGKSCNPDELQKLESVKSVPPCQRGISEKELKTEKLNTPKNSAEIKPSCQIQKPSTQSTKSQSAKKSSELGSASQKKSDYDDYDDYEYKDATRDSDTYGSRDYDYSSKYSRSPTARYAQYSPRYRRLRQESALPVKIGMLIPHARPQTIQESSESLIAYELSNSLSESDIGDDDQKRKIPKKVSFDEANLVCKRSSSSADLEVRSISAPRIKQHK